MQRTLQRGLTVLLGLVLGCGKPAGEVADLGALDGASTPAPEAAVGGPGAAVDMAPPADGAPDSKVEPADVGVRVDAGGAPPDAGDGGLLPRDGALPPPSLPEWPTSTLVFSQGRLAPNGVDDDRVELGYVEIDARREVDVCGGPGAWARRTAYVYTHATASGGGCPGDQRPDASAARWDHVAPTVDDCPGPEAWVDDAPFLFDCPAHVPAGFGREAGRRVVEGQARLDPEAGTLVLRFDDAGRCRKEYYRDLRASEDGALVAMDLDGARTADQSATHRGTGATHGFGFLSPAPADAGVPLADAMARFRASPVVERKWKLVEERPELELDEGAEIGDRYDACGPVVFHGHRCARGDTPPYLDECAARGDGRTAYLAFVVDPFPGRPDRANLLWEWHAFHGVTRAGAGQSTGCYHRGSHVYPMLQVVDAGGVARGWVHVELQRSQRELDDGTFDWTRTNYKVGRWIERGYE